MYTNYRFMNRSYGSSSPQNSYTSIYPRKPRMSSVVNPQANPSNNIFFKKPDVLLQQRANADLITNNQLSPNHNLPRIRKNESRLNISKSPSPQNSYDGSFVRRHSRDQSPEMRGRSGRLKSLAFRKEMESEIAIPERISRIVVGIYSHTGIDNEPTAMGILIGTRLILTSHIAVPNETLATKYTFKFVNDDCVYKSNIKKFFFTSANENLTLLSINPVDQDLSKRKPVLLEANLKETEAERLCYISPKAYSAFVSSTELDNFGFTTLKPVLSGAPVFNYEWKFLGISHTYTKLYKFTQAASIDSIFKFLNRLKQQIPRDSALGSLIDSLDLSGKEHDHLENSYLYWFE